MNVPRQAILPNRHPATRHIEGFTHNASTAQVKVLPEYDIITIGGGINGSGIARDAAERGLKVLLLDKNDFGGGTSAYSSRLIHGGLRYLANAEIDLVHESLQEREHLLRNAPHLVRPVAMALPLYEGAEKPKWLIRVGMFLYDLLSHGKSVPSHQMLDRKTFLQRYPGINPNGLKGGAVYYDAQVNLPERICVENAVAAKATGNATVLNHAQVTGIVLENRVAAGVTFTDLLTGEQFTARGKVIINAAGPWVDDVLKLSTSVQAKNVQKPRIGASGSDDVPPLRQRIGGTKGSHIVVKKFPDAPETALYVEAKSDGRPFFIIPWKNDTLLIGTTDLHYKGNLDHVVAERDEVNYLLQETNYVLPQAKLGQNDVLYTYSGVRPLPYAGDKKAGKITRKHIIENHAKDRANPIDHFLTIIGGKLTTYRNLAEETVNTAIKRFGLKPAITRSTTRNTPLPGGQGIDKLEAFKQNHVIPASREFSVPPETVSHLIDLYGSRYQSVLQLTETNPLLKEPLAPGSRDIGAQVVYAVREELAETVSDVLLRRIGNGLDTDAGLNAVEPTAQIMARELGWTPAKMQAEIDAYRQFITQTNLAFQYS